MKKQMYFVIGILIGVLMMLALMSFPAHAVSGKEVGKVTCIKRIIDGNDVIRVIRVVDPENPFVAIFFTTVKSGKIFAMADPSNTAIAARLIDEVPVDKNGKQKINKKTNTNIASLSKSIGSKVMKIARFYDAEKNTLCYLVYTTKLLDGSLKHSLSVVPLGRPLVK